MYINFSNDNSELRRRSIEEEERLMAIRYVLEAKNANNTAQAAAVAVGGGGGGINLSPGLYTVADDGLIYSYDTFTNFPIEGGLLGGFPAAYTVCCDKGDGTFYYLFNNGGFYFGTIDSNGSVTDYDPTNLNDVAVSGSPMSLYLEANGDLIMVDAKDKGYFHNIIRLVPDSQTRTVIATLVQETGSFGSPSWQVRSLFKYNEEVYGIVRDNDTTVHKIGKFNINTGYFDGGEFPINDMQLYRDGQLSNNQGDPNDWIVRSVVQGNDGIVYMTAFYDDPITEQFEFGIFAIAYGPNGLQDANWLKSANILGTEAASLFNGYASTYVYPDYGTLALRWDPIGNQNSTTPLAVTYELSNFTGGPLSITNMQKSSNYNVWPVGSVDSVTLDETKYLEFSITAPDSTQFRTVTYAKLSYISAPGASCRFAAIRSSADSFADTIAQVQFSGLYDGFETLVFDVSSLTPTNEITFRLYFWGAETNDNWVDLVSTYLGGAGLSVYTT